MRAAVLTEINTPLQLLELDQEPPHVGEVRIRVKAAGVWMSEWHINQRRLAATFADGVGTRGGGRRRRDRAGVTAVAPGDHVIFSFRPHCGRCRYCSSGRTVLCNCHND